MANDPTEQQVCSGETWNRFCEQLRRSGEQILRAEAPADAQIRAEGFRYLTRLLRIALGMHPEFADPDFPGFITPSHETAKIGADNFDNLYRYARLNGAQRYRVSGQRGSVAYLSFGTQKGGYETDGKMIQTGFIDASQLELDAQGNFQIRVNALACGWMWGRRCRRWSVRVPRPAGSARRRSRPNPARASPAGVCAPMMNAPGRRCFWPRTIPAQSTARSSTPMAAR